MKPIFSMDWWCVTSAARAWSRSIPIKRFRKCATGSHREPKERVIKVSLLNENGHLIGVLTRRDLLNSQTPGTTTIENMITRRPSIVYEDSTLREAADHMVRHEVGRLPVISRKEPWKVLGMVTRSDILAAHRRRITAMEPGAKLPIGQLF